MPFYVDVVAANTSPSRITHVNNSSQTETLKGGDVVEAFDHIFLWDHHCVKASELERWRQNADPLCDSAIRTMFKSTATSHNRDLLETLTEHSSSDEVPQPILDFVEAINCQPPPGIVATLQEITIARDFFYSCAAPILRSLMHFSLAGGFASPRIVRVLESTSYLLPRNNDPKSATTGKRQDDKTYGRLLETLQFVLDVMNATPSTDREPSLEPFKPFSSESWKSIIRVRMLHAIARRKVWENNQNGRFHYSYEDNGQPVNQEDMAATLASFAAAPLWCLQRMSFPVSKRQREAYVAVWRHIGFYFGVDCLILLRHFHSADAASKFLASSAIHLFDFDTDPRGAASPTMAILRAISGRPPYASTLEEQCAMTRYLLGSALADHLEVPKTTIKAELRLRFSIFLLRFPNVFGCVYLPSWSERRRAVMRIGLARVVRYQLGMRRTTFRPVEPQGEGLSRVALDEEAIMPDPAGAATLTKEWKLILTEMILVSTLVVAAASIATFWCGHYFLT